jgi:hypothetical protein
MKIILEIQQVREIGQMRLREGKLRLYQPYLHKLANGNFQLRTVTENSNVSWIDFEARKGNIYIPVEDLSTEKS